MTVIKDTIDSSSVEDTLADGEVAVRAFIVTDVTGEGDAKLRNAKATAGIPALGEYHPTIPDVRCFRRSASGISGSSGNIRVLCSYKLLNADEDNAQDDPRPQITVGSTIQSTQTTNDSDGNPISLGGINILTYDTAGNASTTFLKKQSVLVNVQVPQTTVTFSRKEDESPGTKSMAYVGKINGGTFMSQPARTVLCTAITGVSSDGGETYDVTYEFQILSSGWDADVVYRDPETGYPLDGANEAQNTKKTVQIYKTANFGSLDLQT